MFLANCELSRRRFCTLALAMNRIHEKLEQYIHELSNVPNSDALVNASSVFQIKVDGDFSTYYVLPIDSTWKRLLKSANDLIKETDVNPLCLIPGSIKWKIKGKEVLTPLAIYPVHWKYDKVREQVELTIQTDRVEINPFVRFLVRENSEQILELSRNHEELLDLVKLQNELRGLGFEFEYEPTLYFANLHYHRFHLLRELELLNKKDSFSQPLLQLFDASNQENKGVKLSQSLLTDADTDQLELFRAYSSGNLVVQGPPGTGKSQVILNLIGKLLEQNQRVLILSEKRVALEVIEKKLAQLNLDCFAFVCHSQIGSKEFLEKLECTWRFLEHEIEKSTFFDLTSERIQHMQRFLDRLNQKELLGGIDFATFLKLAKDIPFHDAVLRLDAPEIVDWLALKPVILQLEQKNGSLQFLQHLRANFFQHTNIQRLLETLNTQWHHLAQTLAISTWKELLELHRLLGRLQLIENTFFSFYSKLNAKKTDKKRFEKTVLRYKSIIKELELLELEMGIWKQIPTSIQVEQWEQMTGFWGMRKRKKEVNAFLNGSTDLFDQAIAIWKRWWALKLELNEIDQQFIAWELIPSAAQIDAAYAVYEQFEKEGTLLFELAEMDAIKRREILNSAGEITAFVSEFRMYFSATEDMNLTRFFTEKLSHVANYQVFSEQLNVLPSGFLNMIDFATSVKDIEAIILKANWIRIETHFPELAKHSGTRLLEKLELILQEQEEGFSAFAHELINKQKQQFQAYHTLLLKPAAKLSSSEKELKTILKRGKALLVKEFGKSRQHQSLRTLLESDARIWIQTCIPIWMSTPGLVADNFPLETNLVDHLIIDEASQMPLPNALGAIQRANQVLIAGDAQQMSPSTFFGKAISEHDVLHQAAFYYKHTALHHHYRSTNPRLIEFSNRHFYSNNLVVYPKPNLDQAVFHHFVEMGCYAERINEVEAKEVADYIVGMNLEKSIGLVAFSKEQLQTIWKGFSPKLQARFLEKEEAGTFFMKALEDVQGDEAEIIVVSLGYGKDEKGKFALRFGPLNHANGYKRLNVLLTRAIEEIHFFSSIKAAEFPLSENENVNLLRQYLEFLESVPSLQVPSFPYNVIPTKLDGNRISIEGLERSITNANELLTFVKVLKNRGWNISLT